MFRYFCESILGKEYFGKTNRQMCHQYGRNWADYLPKLEYVENFVVLWESLQDSFWGQNSEKGRTIFHIWMHFLPISNQFWPVIPISTTIIAIKKVLLAIYKQRHFISNEKAKLIMKKGEIRKSFHSHLVSIIQDIMPLVNKKWNVHHENSDQN